ncbi:CRISPR-associated endonuclease Cas2 [candidate division KSB1 bacterium]
MNILLTYDVNTETKAGRRRLRKVAIECKNYGQRVQKSVFECRVDDVQFEKLRSKLIDIIDKEIDSLRIYRFYGDREKYIEVYGIDNYIDFDAPLIC